VSKPRSSRRKRAWVLANVIGGVTLVVVLSVVLIGSPGSGQPGSTASALKADDPNSGPSGPVKCTQFQQMVGQCPDPTTTTTTPYSASAHAASSGGGSTTRSSTLSGASGAAVPGSTTVPAVRTPAAPPASPPVAANPSGCSGTAPPVPAPSGSWHCSFDDEFNGTSLDSSKWSVLTTQSSGYTTGPFGNQACYVDNGQTVSESGGYLNLSLVKSPQRFDCIGPLHNPFGSDVMGGEVMSQYAQEYGYFEVRSSLPPTNIPGLQETLWLYPKNQSLYGPWPDSGEIDFGEFYSEYPNLDIPYVHYPGSQNDPNATTNTCAIPGTTTAGQFHTYGLLWTPTTLTVYYDGVTCITDVYGPHVSNPDTAPAPFNQPFFLNFTAALGSANGDEYRPNVTPLPATTQIDWARTWQYG
jgi:beta-glucanase (GH16 family)